MKGRPPGIETILNFIFLLDVYFARCLRLDFLHLYKEKYFLNDKYQWYVEFNIFIWGYFQHDPLILMFH